MGVAFRPLLGDLKDLIEPLKKRDEPITKEVQRIILTLGVLAIFGFITIYPLSYVVDWTSAKEYLNTCITPVIGIVGIVIGYFFGTKSKS